ncbi:Protein CBG22881 [Caenorhabditis briggsae]|uniref:Protein CBG22881 n=1 Tax=Caenorhabditis briggsae TaxID=6238 RepID=A8Y3A3_CAEBR|nr:Protein CBG22881 [Caenorhabditis briggsae]CAP39372.2 Protein CBG22881 [Caenorhabditis briggsae]
MTPLKNCQICHIPTNGKRHYGVVSCRACAAFFRRAGCSNRSKKCKKLKNCVAKEDGFFACKFCRLQKCLNAGMSSESFQFNRGGYQVAKIPMTMDTFLGKPNFIIFRASNETSSSKNFIDVQYLIDRVAQVLQEGPETPIISKSKLGKLSLGLRNIQGTTKYPDPKSVEMYGKNEALAQVEYDILSVTKWVTHFDEFQKLPHVLKETGQGSFIPCLGFEAVGLFMVFKKYCRGVEVLDVYRSKVRSSLGHVFDIFDIEVSHPELFIDLTPC